MSPPVASNEMPLAQSPAAPNSAMPPTLSTAMTIENNPTDRVPEAFTRYAKTISPTPRIGTRTLSGSPLNARSV